MRNYEIIPCMIMVGSSHRLHTSNPIVCALALQYDTKASQQFSLISAYGNANTHNCSG